MTRRAPLSRDELRYAVLDSRAAFPHVSKLHQCRPRLKEQTRQPWMSSGQIACVFDFSDGAHRYAVRVLTRLHPDWPKRYGILERHLRKHRPHGAVRFEFHADGVPLQGATYPVVLMEWVSGQSLGQWVAERCRQKDGAALKQMASQWCRLVLDWERHRIAHGDLHHENVRVTEDGQLRLIDYDNLWVPKLSGQPALFEVGMPKYQHPRRPRHLHCHQQDFPAAVIHLALRALAVDPALHAEFAAANDSLLFDEKDLRPPFDGPVWRRLEQSPDPEVRHWAEELRRAAAGDFEACILSAALGGEERSHYLRFHRQCLRKALAAQPRRDNQVAEQFDLLASAGGAPDQLADWQDCLLARERRRVLDELRKLPRPEEATPKSDARWLREFPETLLEGCADAAELRQYRDGCRARLAKWLDFRQAVNLANWRMGTEEEVVRSAAGLPASYLGESQARLDEARMRLEHRDRLQVTLSRPDLSDAERAHTFRQAVAAAAEPRSPAEWQACLLAEHRARVQKQMAQLAQPPSPAGDRRLLDFFPPGLFRGLPADAEPFQLVEAARRRLQELAQLEEAILAAQVVAPDTERAIAQAVAQLSAGLAYAGEELGKRALAARARVEVHERFQQALQGPSDQLRSDRELAEAFEEVQRLQLTVSQQQADEARAACRRWEALAAFTRLSSKPTPEKDRRWLAAWRQELEALLCPGGLPASREAERTITHVRATRERESVRRRLEEEIGHVPVRARRVKQLGQQLHDAGADPDHEPARPALERADQQLDAVSRLDALPHDQAEECDREFGWIWAEARNLLAACEEGLALRERASVVQERLGCLDHLETLLVDLRRPASFWKRCFLHKRRCLRQVLRLAETLPEGYRYRARADVLSTRP